jgi:hypothetical protein
VRLGHETSTHYFSCLGGTSTDSTKSASGQVMSNLCLLSGGIYRSHGAFQCVYGAKHRHGIFHARVALVRFPYKPCPDMSRQTCVFVSGGICGPRKCISVRLGHESSTHYFSCSGGPSMVSIKSVARHVTLKFGFASGGICGSCSAFWSVRGAKRRSTIFLARVG